MLGQVIRIESGSNTYPHDPECQSLPPHEPVIHEDDRWRIGQAGANSIRNTLRHDEVSGTRRKGAQRQSQAHNDEPNGRRPQLKPRDGLKEHKRQRKKHIGNALRDESTPGMEIQKVLTYHGTGANHGNVSGTFEWFMRAVEVLEDTKGERETWDRQSMESHECSLETRPTPDQSLNDKASSQEEPCSFSAVNGWQVGFLVGDVIARRYFECFPFCRRHGRGCISPGKKDLTRKIA